jgi:hypothetical protein
MKTPRISSSQYPRQSRTDARQSKLRALTVDQKQSLLRWLNEDKLAYAVVRERLAKEYGISIAVSGICRFWHSHCAGPKATSSSDVLLDVIVQSAAPVRLTVKMKDNGVTVRQLSCA